MVFTTQLFLFVFFPLCLSSYLLLDFLERRTGLAAFLAKYRLRDLLLILFSLAFYMWAFFDDIYRLLIYILLLHFAARRIERARRSGLGLRLYREGEKGEKPYKTLSLALFPLCAALFAFVFYLVYINYTPLLGQIWNLLFDDALQPQRLLAPLGLSFITFSAVSYLCDVYRGQATAGSLIDCALYISFFPKVVSGPIVLWKDFQPQIRSRRVGLELSAEGVNRIMMGFAKKVLLADIFGACLAQTDLKSMDQITALASLLLFMLQLYYDFSAYSDIALGLARLFGFEFKENFNFPYRSKSISEFWRRWHISLGSWFREYVYIPLGGSRAGLRRTLRNLGLVFLLTGIWHGAGWNYILWGALNGLLVILERLLQDKKVYKLTPDWIKYGFTMLAVMLLWQLFRFQELADAGLLLRLAFGLQRHETLYYSWPYYLSPRVLSAVCVGLLGATLLGSPRLRGLGERLRSSRVGYALQEVFWLLVFALSILFMVNSTYSPFLYFQY